jgi:beta-galactosidase
MNLGVQYYRAPFPEQKYWEDDFKRIKDSGLNTVQLWILWAWVEAKPGTFVFDDYDRLMELADRNSLGVILSTIAEIQPYWVHREVPDSEMVDHMGHQVISSNRGECHFGLTPGGCTDNPGVWAHMSRFLTRTVERYGKQPALRGWDAWNELRWNVNADARVCHCRHTLAAFHAWLDLKYGGLDGLNRAWKRRYDQWDEVLPGKMPRRPYTEMMAWEHFITWRANQHGRLRYELIKKLDPIRPVTVHAGDPSAVSGGWTEATAIDRGNDWNFADDLDGVGCSSFPKLHRIDDADFAVRVEFVKSAARQKLVWLSEVQGGGASLGFEVHQPVDAVSQQRWIWNGLACGADTILFWCWRDEVFGGESAGWGLAGRDGLAEERLAAMKVTGDLLENNRSLLEAYQPDKATVGVFFSPQSYYLTWAEDGNGNRAAASIAGYCRALVKSSIPYVVVEEEHLAPLDGLQVLFLPRTIVMSEAVEDALSNFVRKGGTLVCESECGAFNPQGLYKYPPDRFIARLCGLSEVGRRSLATETIDVRVGKQAFQLGVKQWITPWERSPSQNLWSDHADGALVSEVPVAKGRLILCGCYLGDAYRENENRDFEEFTQTCVLASGWQPKIRTEVPQAQDGLRPVFYIKSGTSRDNKMLFVFFAPGANSITLRFAKGFLPGPVALDLVSGKKVAVKDHGDSQELHLSSSAWGFVMLVVAPK